MASFEHPGWLTLWHWHPVGDIRQGADAMKVLCIWTMKSLRPPSPAPLQRSHDTQRAACSLHLGSQTPDVGRQASHAKLLRMVPKSLGRMQTFANHTKQRQRTYTKAIKGSAPFASGLLVRRRCLCQAFG